MVGMALPLVLNSKQLLEAVARLEHQRLAPRTLAQWAATNLVLPSVDWPRRHRSPRLYGLRDLAKARLVLRLRAAGISMPRVRVVMAELAATDDLPMLLRPESRAWLSVDGYRVRIHRVGQPPLELPQRQFVLELRDVAINNAEVVREIRAAA